MCQTLVLPWQLATRPSAQGLIVPCHVQPGKVVIVLQGRHAGKKAVIVKNHDDGTSGRKYGHALVCGLSKEPRKVRLSVSVSTVCCCVSLISSRTHASDPPWWAPCILACFDVPDACKLARTASRTHRQSHLCHGVLLKSRLRAVVVEVVLRTCAVRACR